MDSGQNLRKQLSLLASPFTCEGVAVPVFDPSPRAAYINPARTQNRHHNSSNSSQSHQHEGTGPIAANFSFILTEVTGLVVKTVKLLNEQVIVLAALFAVALANEAYPKYPAPAYPAPKYDYVSAATCR